ncbi:MAG TPA: hypothetical protein VLJ39_02645 [Tepidisphaeraceae bacterium]|nr:hypothetical protein [Tepidisphaeraceae bacterium]
MQVPWLPMLASADEGLVKFGFFVLVLIIWGVSSLAKAAKSKPTAPRPRVTQPLVPSTPQPANLPPLPTIARQRKRKAVPPPPPPARGISVAAAPSTPRASRPAPAGPAVARLFEGRTVRAQFILAEVLQPPLALRTKRNF